MPGIVLFLEFVTHLILPFCEGITVRKSFRRVQNLPTYAARGRRESAEKRDKLLGKRSKERKESSKHETERSIYRVQLHNIENT